MMLISERLIALSIRVERRRLAGAGRARDEQRPRRLADDTVEHGRASPRRSPSSSSVGGFRDLSSRRSTTASPSTVGSTATRMSSARAARWRRARCGRPAACAARRCRASRAPSGACHRRREPLREALHLVEDPVDANPHDAARPAGVEVDVAGAVLGRLDEDRVDEPHERRVGDRRRRPRDRRASSAYLERSSRSGGALPRSRSRATNFLSSTSMSSRGATTSSTGSGWRDGARRSPWTSVGSAIATRSRSFPDLVRAARPPARAGARGTVSAARGSIGSICEVDERQPCWAARHPRCEARRRRCACGERPVACRPRARPSRLASRASPVAADHVARRGRDDRARLGPPGPVRRSARGRRQASSTAASRSAAALRRASEILEFPPARLSAPRDRPGVEALPRRVRRGRRYASRIASPRRGRRSLRAPGTGRTAPVLARGRSVAREQDDADDERRQACRASSRRPRRWPSIAPSRSASFTSPMPIPFG